jgi:hypothetical protein
METSQVRNLPASGLLPNGMELTASASSFRTEYKEMSKWTRNHSDNKPFHLFGASTTSTTTLKRENMNTPHLVLRLLSNYPADERLARSELIVLTNFIRSGIKTQVHASRGKAWSGLNVKVPVCIPSSSFCLYRVWLMRIDPPHLHPQPGSRPHRPGLLRRDSQAPAQPAL